MQRPQSRIPDRALTAADLILLAALRNRANRVVLEPSHGGQWSVVVHGRRRPLAATFMPRDLAQAASCRLRLIAGLDPLTAAPQCGLFELTSSSGNARMFARTEGSGERERVELWLLGETEEAGDALERPCSLGPGTAVGSLVVGERIGSGGTAIIYRARHRLLGTDCAIKVLRPEMIGDSDALSGFFREARIAAQNASERTLAVLDVGTLADGRPFIVSELVSGCSFDELLEVTGPIEPIRAARLVREAAAALASLHDRGIVHGDVTAGNLFVTGADPDEQVKLIDFGLARPADQTEPTGDMVCGTPYYMSPELIRGHATDARSDLYSLGVVLFELLAGDPPFLGETAAEIAEKHLLAPVPELAAPRKLRQIARRLLDKRPERRFESARDLADEIDRFLPRPMRR